MGYTYDPWFRDEYNPEDDQEFDGSCEPEDEHDDLRDEFDEQYHQEVDSEEDYHNMMEDQWLDGMYEE